MSIVNCCIFYFAVEALVGRGRALVELPKVEENEIKKAELVIRTTTNVLFSTLKLRNKRKCPRLQYFTLVHHYLTSLTLQDYTTLREIAKLTRVDKKNVDKHFITTLTEILDDENNNLEKESIKKSDGLDEADKFIEEYMRDLEYKLYYANQDVDIEIVKLIMAQESLKNGTNSTGDLDVWKPSADQLSGRRIFEGKSTRIKKYPFMASVHVFNEFMCAGCIIKSDLVLTAASCLQLAYNNRLFRENPSFLTVRVGSTFFYVTGEKLSVIEVYFHPSYNPRTLHNNIAVMRLHRKINFKNKAVSKIEIDRHATPLSELTDGILVLGWGAKTRSNKIYSPMENKLSEATLDFFPLSECADVYSKKYVTDKHFCAGFFSKGGGACNHDVGGPGVVGATLVGIISFGSTNCGAAGAPTVFTKVGYYSDWIEEIMEQDVPYKPVKTTTTPRPRAWGLPDSSGYTIPTRGSIVPIMGGSTPYPIELAHPSRLRTRQPQKENNMKSILKTIYGSELDELLSSFHEQEDFNHNMNEDSEDAKVLPQANANTVTTAATLADDIEDRLPKLRTVISEVLYTPEPTKSGESISDEEPSKKSNNTGTGTIDMTSASTEDLEFSDENGESSNEVHSKEVNTKDEIDDNSSGIKTKDYPKEIVLMIDKFSPGAGKPTTMNVKEILSLNVEPAELIPQSLYIRENQPTKATPMKLPQTTSAKSLPMEVLSKVATLPETAPKVIHLKPLPQLTQKIHPQKAVAQKPLPQKKISQNSLPLKALSDLVTFPKKSQINSNSEQLISQETSESIMSVPKIQQKKISQNTLPQNALSSLPTVTFPKKTQFNSNTEQLISQETSESIVPRPKIQQKKLSQKTLPQKSLSALPIRAFPKKTQLSTNSEQLISQETSESIVPVPKIQHKTLPTPVPVPDLDKDEKESNLEIESVEKSSKEKPSDANNEVLSESESESESEAMPLEMGDDTPATETTFEALRKASTTQVTPDDLLDFLMSKTSTTKSDIEAQADRLAHKVPLSGWEGKDIKKAQPSIDDTILTLLYLSENEKDNDINSLLDNTTLALIENEFKSDAENNKNLSPRTRYEKADNSDKLDVNNDAGKNNVLFNILRQAVGSEMMDGAKGKRVKVNNYYALT